MNEWVWGIGGMILTGETGVLGAILRGLTSNRTRVFAFLVRQPEPWHVVLKDESWREICLKIQSVPRSKHITTRL